MGRCGQSGFRASRRRCRRGKAGNLLPGSWQWAVGSATALQLRSRSSRRSDRSAHRQQRRGHRPLPRREWFPASSRLSWSGASENPRRSVIIPLASRSTKSAGVPPPGELFGSGNARATSCPIMSPPMAGETTASILLSEKSAASACPSFSANRGYCRTSAHWTYVPLCSPLDNSKCPWRMAPAVSNSFSNSSRFSMRSS